MNESQRSIPQELESFFSSPGGHSLVVRGEAGTGKTTLALHIIETMSTYDRCFYFSTRVSDYLLLRQFPWLGGSLYGEDLDEWIKNQSSWYEELQRTYEQDRKEKMLKGEGSTLDEGLNSLRRSFVEKSRGTGSLRDEKGVILEELEKVYHTVRDALPNRSLIVIDSLDALAEKYDRSNGDIIRVLQKDLVESYGCNLVYILENNDRALDYLGDGVIVLETGELRSRVVRQMRITKLRAQAIKQSRYLYTLNGGRVKAFPNIGETNFLEKVRWRRLPDKNGRTSFGWSELDRITSGGVEKGGLAIIELGAHVPTSFIEMIERSLVANFVSHNRGVLWVPLKKASAEIARSKLVGSLDGPAVDKHVRILEVASQVDRSPAPYCFQVEGADASVDLKWKNLTYSLDGSASPFLSLIGFDTMESLYGEGVADQMADHLSSIRRHMGVFVGIVSQSTRSTQRLADIANLYVKVERSGGGLIVYGEEPFTECNVLSVEGFDDSIVTKLVPML
ncbi:MAG: circadian clock protein KaiC [Methanomassiliicoccales archaeon PtaU1.Bin124]|nr:MAG: circadian clock protein KaiC [Methanomassiliicoccales archaeon PtaU1.Bin124]